MEAFLEETNRFPAIYEIVSETLSKMPERDLRTVGEILEMDRESRATGARIGCRAGQRGSGDGLRSVCIRIEYVLWLPVLIGVMINIHEPAIFGRRAGSMSRSKRSASASARACSGSGAARPISGSPPSPSAAMSKWPANWPGTRRRADDPRSFLAKPRWQRLIIAFAGPFMNIVLAVGILTGMYMVRFDQFGRTQAMIGHVMADSPAAKAGIQDGDRIVNMDGKNNPTWEDVGMKEATSAFRPMHLTIERNGRGFDATVTPVLSERLGGGYAGWDERGEVPVRRQSSRVIPRTRPASRKAIR